MKNAARLSHVLFTIINEKQKKMEECIHYICVCSFSGNESIGKKVIEKDRLRQKEITTGENIRSAGLSSSNGQIKAEKLKKREREREISNE